MNRFLLRFFTALIISGLATATATAQATENDVVTYHNDIYRSGVYAAETILRPSNLNVKRFGKLFTRRVVGQIWGQPLYVEGVPIDGTPRNVVYVATSENWVYAFDADDATQAETTPPLKVVHLGDPASVNPGVFGTIKPSNGISSTPVIDLGSPRNPAQGVLYVVAKLNQDQKFHIVALDLGSLTPKRNVPVEATAPGQGSKGNSTISFDSSDHLNRPALLISNSHLIVAFGSGPNNDADGPSYHGWALSYSLPDLVQTGAFVTTPTTDTGMGGIWQSGNGPAADDQGNIYFMTGNGRFQSTNGLRPDLANSFVKLAVKASSLDLVDWYAPPSRDVLDACDLDLGASGPAVIADAGKVVGAGKSGILYVLDKNKMGGTDKLLPAPGSWRGTPDCTSGQCFRIVENRNMQMNTKQACDMSHYPYPGSNFGKNSNWNDVLNSYPHVHGSPVLWKLGNTNYNLYIWPEEDYLKLYHFDGHTFSTNPTGSSGPLAAAMMSMPGGVLSLSWDGANTGSGIIWVSRPNPENPRIIGGPSIDVFSGHNQQHFAYRTVDGAIRDNFYCPECSGAQWRFQQINCNKNSNCVDKSSTALSKGPVATGGPFISTYSEHNQQHFTYLDAEGGIQDVFYCPDCSGEKWVVQQINQSGLTDAPAALAGPFVNVFSGHDQQHFVYRAAGGTIWDVFYCPGCSGKKWSKQQINCNSQSNCPRTSQSADAVSKGPEASSDPFVSTYSEHNQQHFAYLDTKGGIQDVFYCPDCGGEKWVVQQINQSGLTDAPEAVAAPFVNVFSGHDQQHFVYRAAGGTIWDVFYCPGCSGKKWNKQQINCNRQSNCPRTSKSADAVSKGPEASGGPFVSTYSEHNQQHFAYLDTKGGIQDVFYCPDCSGEKWVVQQINQPGLTDAPAAVAAPFVSVFSGHDQQHFAFRTLDGGIWDSFYCPGCSGAKWRLQEISTSCIYAPSDQNDLTPNDAPCNAINKIVHGYLQAFNALPDQHGVLSELWNSEENPNDRVEWFAKESPPTIAGGKVFVAEFPAKPANSHWNTNNSSGRLIVYGQVNRN
jgi:rubredoxin